MHKWELFIGLVFHLPYLSFFPAAYNVAQIADKPSTHSKLVQSSGNIKITKLFKIFKHSPAEWIRIRSERVS